MNYNRLNSNVRAHIMYTGRHWRDVLGERANPIACSFL